MTAITSDKPAKPQTYGVRKKFGILSAAAMTALLFSTLWPFNPFPRNEVRWLPGGPGIEFGRPGVVVSKTDLRVDEADSQRPFTLELLLRPASTQSIYTILAFYSPDNPKQFLVRQWTDGLLVSHSVSHSVINGKARIKFDLDHAFQVGRLVVLTIASGPDGTTVYLDGHQAQAFPKFKVSLRDLKGQIVLGTSPVDYEPWPGEVHGLAVYSGKLSPDDVLRHYQDWTNRGARQPDLNHAIVRYAFADGAGAEVHSDISSGPDLEMPATFSVPHKAMLTSPIKEFQETWNYALDLVLNIAGFIPLGIVVCAYLACGRSRRAAIFSTTLVGGILSFLIEVAQAYIPRRVSGCTDIITNTIGTALGAWLSYSGAVRGIFARLRLAPEKPDLPE